jgi:hypothetical protein
MPTRQFETDYAGVWKGHCKTRESAIIAAIRHVVNDGYTACTITNKTTGHVIARVRRKDSGKGADIQTVNPLRRFPKELP